MTNNFNIFHDHARTILESAPSLDDSLRGDAWDVWHNSSASELSDKLAPLNLPDDVAQQLVAAKQQVSAATQPPEHPAIAAINKLASLPRATLTLAESHPAVLRALVDGSKD